MQNSVTFEGYSEHLIQMSWPRGVVLGHYLVDVYHSEVYPELKSIDFTNHEFS